jgi:hypothetical protein
MFRAVNTSARWQGSRHARIEGRPTVWPSFLICLTRIALLSFSRDLCFEFSRTSPEIFRKVH